MKVRIYKRARQKHAVRINRFMGRSLQAGSNLLDFSALHSDSHISAPINQCGVMDQQVEHLAFSLAIRLHQRLWVAGLARYEHQCNDGQHVGQH